MIGRTIAQIPWIRAGQKARRNGIRVHAYRVDQELLKRYIEEERIRELNPTDVF
jgi:hypothetical protein